LGDVASSQIEEIKMKSATHLKATRQHLEAERVVLLERIAEVTQQLDAPEEQTSELVDMAASVETRQLQTTLLEQSQQHLQHIEAALQRLAEGRYGLCTLCGQPIASERLAVLPYTITCVTCQKQQEQIHGQHRSLA
jgi:DnaK suppressor protein